MNARSDRRRPREYFQQSREGYTGPGDFYLVWDAGHIWLQGNERCLNAAFLYDWRHRRTIHQGQIMFVIRISRINHPLDLDLRVTHNFAVEL